MKPLDMLHQMCSGVLSDAEVKALCKARGFPPETSESRGILETLFLSSQGLSDVIATLRTSEVALLHLLRNCGSPVDVTVFSSAYGGRKRYGTFNQRYQDVFKEVRQRLVRSGVLLLAEAPAKQWEKKTKIQRWRFALPAEFYRHLPPLIPSPRKLDVQGKSRSSVVRDRLSADLSHRRKKADQRVFHFEANELCINGKCFEVSKLIAWQQSGWKHALKDGKKSNAKDSGSKKPDEAALCILSELADGYWADSEQLAEPLRIFCGQQVDVDAVCEAGCDWGRLAKQRVENKTWYRLAQNQRPVAPDEYLAAHDDDNYVAADLAIVPFDALEQIVAVSDQSLAPGKKGTLLLAPNFVKLGRADDKLLATEAIGWLVEHTRPFAEAYVRLSERRGKTVLHENLYVARVGDLSLKVAIEKALGKNRVSLKNDFIAFPQGLLDDVRRVVKKSGHVVKEIAAK